MVKRKPAPEPPPPAITVTNRWGLVKDKQRAGHLFDAILRAVQKANARAAREREEAADGRKRAS